MAETTYTVRFEYLVIAYATAEVTAASPEAAVERMREMERDGRLSFAEDHESLGGRTAITVWHDGAAGRPVLVIPGAVERMAAAGRDLEPSPVAVPDGEG